MINVLTASELGQFEQAGDKKPVVESPKNGPVHRPVFVFPSAGSGEGHINFTHKGTVYRISHTNGIHIPRPEITGKRLKEWTEALLANGFHLESPPGSVKIEEIGVYYRLRHPDITDDEDEFNGMVTAVDGDEQFQLVMKSGIVETDNKRAAQALLSRGYTEW